MIRTIARREVPAAAATLEAAGIDPVLARLYASRGVHDAAELDLSLAGLPPPSLMKGADEAAERLVRAIDLRERIVIVADYDADGATACAIGMRALGCMGADVRFLVPNRFEHGYGLTPEIVDLAGALAPRLIVTVDNGIASVEGVARANELGIAVLVTDHHLPGPVLPDAACIVNPNQPGCGFPSKNLAGVGVMFYVLLALRAELRARGRFTAATQPRLDSLLDLVALGTVADVVPLDRNNRILVAQGLERIRNGRLHAGMAALFQVAGKDARTSRAMDLGFAIGPRINAAGRLTDMTVGIECLTTDSFERGLELARQLDQLNRDRREIESDMQLDALAKLDADTVEAAIGELVGPVKESLAKFEQQIAGARTFVLREEAEQFRASGEAITIGWFFAAAIAIGYFAGAWIDRQADCEPWGTTAGVLLGIGAGFKNLIDIANRLSRVEDENARLKRESALTSEQAHHWNWYLSSSARRRARA
mgnify:CR=1 FL=1